MAYLENFFLKTTRNNHSFPNNGPIKKKFPQNLIIYAKLTMNSRKFKTEAINILILVYL